MPLGIASGAASLATRQLVNICLRLVRLGGLTRVGQALELVGDFLVVDTLEKSGSFAELGFSLGPLRGTVRSPA